jgi:type II secretion system protein C
MKKTIPAWAITIAWCISVAVSAVFISQLISLYLQNKLAVPRNLTVVKQEPEQQEKRQKPFHYYRSSIVTIFGDQKAPPPVTKKNDEKKPEENLDPLDPVNRIPWDQYLVRHNPNNVKLKGTIIGSNTALALLKVDGNDITMYQGQRAGGYNLDVISKSSITFVKGNDKRIVAMESDPDSSLADVPQPPTPPVEENNTMDPENNDLDGIISFQGDRRIIDRRKFDELLKPPSRLAHEVKFIPNSKDGEPYGIRISYLKPDSFFSKVGLRSGDILIRTNDKILKTVEDSFYAYQAFRNEDHLLMEVDRNGQIVHIPMEFR